ncbi:hypothetical protein AAE478_007723 [Parahypoxylon ruwenzoriense]
MKEEITPKRGVQEDLAEAADRRPESSPYASPFVILYFRDGPPLSIRAELIRVASKLFSRCGDDKTLHLEDIPGDVGHVLVHYLVTGTYQCLEPKGSSPQEKHAAEFAISVRAYSVAQDYELPGLEKLARDEIKRLGGRLSVIQILDVMRTAHPTLRSEDTWLHDYLKSLVKPLVYSPPATFGKDVPEKTLSVAAAVLKIAVELCREKMDMLWTNVDKSDTSRIPVQDAQPQAKPAVPQVQPQPAVPQAQVQPQAQPVVTQVQPQPRPSLFGIAPPFPEASSKQPDTAQKASSLFSSSFPSNQPTPATTLGASTGGGVFGVYSPSTTSTGGAAFGVRSSSAASTGGPVLGGFGSTTTSKSHRSFGMP